MENYKITRVNITNNGGFSENAMEEVFLSGITLIVSALTVTDTINNSNTGSSLFSAISATTLSGGTIYSGNTNLQNTFNALNVQFPTKANLSGATFTGQINVTALSATTLSGGTITSGSTDLYSIFQTIGGSGSGSFSQPGSNIATGGTSTNQIISLVASPSINGIISSGASQLNTVTAVSISGDTVSGGTIYSGGTNLQNTFNTLNSQLSTKANLSGATFTGQVNGTALSATTLSGGTITSGSTDLYSIFQTVGGSGSGSFNQPGSNITTGGTATNQTVSLVASPSVNGIISSGASQLNTVTAVSISGGTVSGGTIYSGGTNLYSIFATVGGTGATITGAANVGSGTGVYKQTVGTTLQFNSLSGGSNVWIVSGDTITINASGKTDLQSVEQSLSSTTSSTSFVDLPGFSATTNNLGGTGKYEIEFDCFTSVNTQNASIFFQLVVNGVAIADSLRRVNQYASAQASLAYMDVATSTVQSAISNGTVIKVQWRVSSGTATLYSGTLRFRGTPTTNIV